MRVLIVSKALINAGYREKLVQLARLKIDVTAVVPSTWREGDSVQQLEHVRHQGYSLIETPLRLNGHFHLHYYPHLPSLIRDRRPDIVHVDEEPYNLATFHGVRAAHRAAIPSLFFSWQNLLRRYPPPFSLLERSVYRMADHALAGTEEVAEVLRAKGCNKPISVVPQFGVDPAQFRPRPRPNQPFTVGFFNRLIPAKGPLLALEAFAALPPESRLRFIGDGPMRPVLEREIVQRGLVDRVTIQSRVPSGDMPAAISGTDVIILPSVTTPSWKEQFGRILVEAMACGVPVVGSDSGEIPRVIGDAGLIVPEGDGHALGRALRDLAADRSIGSELGVRGRERVLQYFTHERIAEATARAYRQTLDTSLRRRGTGRG